MIYKIHQYAYTSKSQDEVVQELDGLIYKNPIRSNTEDIYTGYETADEYLSGNVLEKLETAIRLNNNRIYDKNVEALNAVQPEPLTAVDIPWKIGLSWISVEDYQQFLYDTLDTRYYFCVMIIIILLIALVLGIIITQIHGLYTTSKADNSNLKGDNRIRNIKKKCL